MEPDEPPHRPAPHARPKPGDKIVPKPGDKILIRWPGGPHDFHMEFIELNDSMPAPHAPGWLSLYGKVGEEYLPRWNQHIYDYRTLYARYVSRGVYEMVRHVGLGPAK